MSRSTIIFASPFYSSPYSLIYSFSPPTACSINKSRSPQKSRFVYQLIPMGYNSFFIQPNLKGLHKTASPTAMDRENTAAHVQVRAGLSSCRQAPTCRRYRIVRFRAFTPSVSRRRFLTYIPSKSGKFPPGQAHGDCI